MAFSKQPYIPFMKDERIKDMDGVYQSTIDGHVHTVKNVKLKSYIQHEEHGPVRIYSATVRSTNPAIGFHKSIQLIDVPWEFLLPL